MQIDSHTRLFAVIGDPVGHSLSPLMHMTAFGTVGYNAVYVALRVTDPQTAVAGVRALGLAGVSVTIPHKTAVVDHLDEVDASAAAIGAVNTIVNDNGRLVGHNTDGLGVVAALHEKTALAGKRVAVIGAGGAARAAGYAVSRQGADVVIVNRTVARGEALAADLGFDFMPLSNFNGVDIDVLINTTAVGMYPATEAMVVNERVLEPHLVVMDAVYNPMATRLLRRARHKGCTTVDGVAMFVHQGAAQFELWTGLEAPVDQMEKTVRETLGKRA